MIIIFGLGNPGRKFYKTRHNVGFRILDSFRKENKFSPWKKRKNFLALISKGKINNKKIILAKSQTFMNDSGKSTKALISFFKAKIPNLIVVHDDIDLPLGKIKIIKNRGAGGHKGVQSIIDELKTKDFIRVRVGIKPGGSELKALEKFVLRKFTKEEGKIMKDVIRKTCLTIKVSITEGLEKAMAEFNSFP